MKRKSRGFTLIEITITIIILGVLATLAIPNFNLTIERVRVKEGEHILRTIYMAQKDFNRENSPSINWASTFTQLDVDIGASNNFVPPTVIPGTLGAVGSIQRTGGAYTLTINTTAQITCTSIDATCTRLGY